MADNVPCDYFYRSQLLVNIPEHLNASILKEEFDIHHAVDILAELASHHDHIPSPSFYELLEKACSNSLYQSPPRWFKNGIIISSSRFPPDRVMYKRLKLKSGEAAQCSTITSGSVGADNAQEGDIYVCKNKRISTEGSIKRSARNSTRKIAPLPRRTCKSNVSVEELTPLFFESLIPPNRVPGENRNKNEAERLHFLQHDPWLQSGSIKPQEVVCRGCGTAIQLERRNTSAASGKPAKYYLSPWVKHRNNCQGIHRDWLTKNGYGPEIKLPKDILEKCKKASRKD
ncbi:hypothetical protein ARMSODRAFT_1027792 [Armillaria solidipes]|uniref:Uncharacterized protein n=1 Tax=Armillaria solidipes TaxID=1076256 RepID=A0A2H3AQE0_9AGAR|nr:hypothetical protein ARMSODRAFT_1027792 [Armillaria solidipes]